MEGDIQLSGQEKNIFPVIRSTSFPSESEEGVSFLFDEHTAETRIYYALDLGTTYRLIDTKLIEKEGWVPERIKETALFNVRSLSTEMKSDEVAGNTYYFLNKKGRKGSQSILKQN